MKEKICLLINSLNPGGMERVTSELANYLSTVEKKEVHLIVYGKERDHFYKISERVIIHKPDFQSRYPFKILLAVRTIAFLRKKVKEIHPDTLLSFGEIWNVFVLISLFGLKYRIFISDRAQPGKQRPLEGLRKWLYRSAAGIIVQTKTAKLIYERKFPHSNIKAIPNPIYQIKRSHHQDRENSILFVGRFIPTKHIDRLIKMFSEINADNWKLIIVGGDHGKSKLSNDLKALIGELNLENSVFLEGYQSNVDQYYLTSKIFAFPSSSEGFPNVVGEALSAGLPVVAYDCVAGPSEMIENRNNGFLIDLHNEKMFKEKLEYLMNHEEQRIEMGEKARESVKKFSVEKIGERFYETITNSGRS
ncbi:glycosyltransferase family 4 protein [Rhodohalobacter sp. 614A]|uniref:glycosyltransferase family 4 protein n=1 Tax=Rhodohalobacter sp. 614A TaxID=2908649 RepID=UPI001F2E5ED1|nr:glycosyltransferase family 4 protein [Rhodohalobacter sp. 614A]